MSRKKYRLRERNKFPGRAWFQKGTRTSGMVSEDSTGNSIKLPGMILGKTQHLEEVK
jgi:hypothetical protein